MGRKVFMSMLGANVYDVCTYKGKRSSTQTNFIQEATLNEIDVRKWGVEDVVCIILTDSARKSNWSKEITERMKRGVPVSYSGLETHLEDMHLPCKIETLDVPDGKDENEMWIIFNTIFEFLENEDELYFDLTHGFRYLPMFLMVLGNYAKFLKNTSVCYMSYGNYEGREINADGHQELDVAPIIDLLPLSLLEDWTFAAGAFKKTGRVESILSSIYVNATNKILPEKIAANVLDMVKKLGEFESSIRACQSKQIIKGEAAVMAGTKIRKINSSRVLPQPLSNALLAIKDAISCYKPSTFDNIVFSLQWCKQYGLVQQGYTLCQEAIVTKFSDTYRSLLPKEKYKTIRDYWSSILGFPKDKISSPEKWREKVAEYHDLSSYLFDNEFIKEIRGMYFSLTKQRNNVNHAGYSGSDSLDHILGEFNDVIDNCIEKIFNVEFPELKYETANSAGKPAIFINYTNHPSTSWGEKQLKAAEEYGEVVDLPFRSVEEDIDEKRLAEIAEEETGKILEFAAGNNATVHIMGEMTLTFAMVAKLKAAGVKCVASTTSRQVVENADGTRTSTFNFVRFRSY